MFTKLFKKFMEIASFPNNVSIGYYPFRNVLGSTKYISNQITNAVFPVVNCYSYNQTAYNYGIVFGSGSTQPTDTDYKIETQITSGLSVTISHSHVFTSDGSSHAMDIVVTNTSSSPITITEIGWNIILQAATAQNGTASYNAGSNANSNTIFLADHTLLDDPVTIPAGSYAVIRYTLGESASAA